MHDVMPQYRRNTTKIGIKYRSIDQYARCFCAYSSFSVTTNKGHIFGLLTCSEMSDIQCIA